MVKWMSVIMKNLVHYCFFTLIIQFEAKSDHSNVTFTSGAKVAYSSSDFIIFDVGKSQRFHNMTRFLDISVMKQVSIVPNIEKILICFINGVHMATTMMLKFK